MISFQTFCTESVFNKVDDFHEKWNNALNSSEELRVALDLMKNIKSKFPKGEIYIVGGVPRDLLKGNDIDDVDMATNIPLDDLSKNFEMRNISKDDSQPVFTILWKDYAYDLAKFRTDSGDVGRQNNVSTETDSFQQDSNRRDLSINAFGLDADGKIVDYQGGIDDLINKIVRAVGDPKQRFMEDATRILRVFRFAAKMDFEIEENTKAAAVELKHLLGDRNAISNESIAKEFYKSAKSGKTLANFLEKLQDTGILHDILPEFTAMEGMLHKKIHHPEGNGEVLGHIYECLKVSPYTDPVINLAIMVHDFGKAVTQGTGDEGQYTYHGHEGAGVPIVQGIFKRLVFGELSAEDKTAILDAVDRHMLVHNIGDLSTKTLSKLIHSPSWEVIKAVSYCDEASRGPAKFDSNEFWKKIKDAEERVHSKMGSTDDELRLKLKKYIDGNKILAWFPQVKKDLKKMKEIVPAAHDFIMDELDADREPTDEQLYNLIKDIVGEPVKESFFFGKFDRQVSNIMQ